VRKELIVTISDDDVVVAAKDEARFVVDAKQRIVLDEEGVGRGIELERRDEVGEKGGHGQEQGEKREGPAEDGPGVETDEELVHERVVSNAPQPGNQTS
jgi:hypothetical protein